MATMEDLIERSGDLKVMLIDYAVGPRLRRAYETTLLERFGPAGPRTDEQMIDFLDAFALQHRLPDGRTVVERFVDRHPKLSAVDREILLGWRDVVEGLFVIQGRDGDALLLDNLIDQLTYRVYSNMGPAFLAGMEDGSFIYTRLVPLGEDWLLSGRQALYGADRQEEIYRAAAEMALKAPRLVFRNPRLLEEGWRFQREEHEVFSAFFGADLLILPGRELPERIRAYMRYLVFEHRDADGRTMAERTREAGGTAAEPPEVPLPDFLIGSETVGVIFDEVDGLNFFPDFGPVAETFEHPELAADPDHAGAVRDYLENPGIVPLPLRRLAERNPANASRVFRQVLNRPRFTWERDGDRLLRAAKPDYYASPVLPGVSPVGGRLAEARLEEPEMAHPATRPRPVTPQRRARPVRRRRR